MRIGAQPSRPVTTPSHDAVSEARVDHVNALIKERNPERPLTVLDGQQRSPLNLVSVHRDSAVREALTQALLQSQNPTAPAGYVKPHLFHGSPWGLEILKSGALKGGVNDPKGGSQSLEGKVFFSDRTPLNDQALTTRPYLRGKARTYSRGNSVSMNGVGNRLKSYALAQALLKNDINMSAQPSTWPREGDESDAVTVKNGLASVLYRSSWVQTFDQVGEVAQGLKLPKRLMLRDEHDGAEKKSNGPS